MSRTSGSYTTSTTLGEPVQAFVPAPLPPAGPPITVDVYREFNHDPELALARLSGVSGWFRP